MKRASPLLAALLLVACGGPSPSVDEQTSSSPLAATQEWTTITDAASFVIQAGCIGEDIQFTGAAIIQLHSVWRASGASHFNTDIRYVGDFVSLTTGDVWEVGKGFEDHQAGLVSEAGLPDGLRIAVGHERFPLVNTATGQRIEIGFTVVLTSNAAGEYKVDRFDPRCVAK